MTELETALHFLELAQCDYPCLAGDVAWLKRVIRHLTIKEKSTTTFEFLDKLIRTFLSYYDALVFGFNSRRFIFASALLRKRPLCPFPRFLGGLTTMVFDDAGSLRPDYDTKALELMFQFFALFRRFKHKRLRKNADIVAVQEFVSYQSRTRRVSDSISAHLHKFWAHLSRNFEQNATLGFPGPGKTLDEKGKYASNYVFLNTHDPKLPDEIRMFYDSAFQKATGFEDSRSWVIAAGNDSVLPQFYDLFENPKLKSVTVPKNSKTSRLITVTHVGNTIVGACYRNTIKSLWRDHGITHQLNVDDQTLSHRTLFNNFDDVCAWDLEGGSSCFTNYLNSKILPDCFKDFLEYTQDSTFVTPDGKEEYKVTTQLMGDSISTGLLTTSLYLCIALADYYYRHDAKIKRLRELYTVANLRGVNPFRETWEQLFKTAFMPSLREIKASLKRLRESPVNVVGDDIIFPKHLEFYLGSILQDLGITVNVRKSSYGDSLYRESCGSWFIKRPDSTIHRIYPFRHPEGDTVPLFAQAATQFLLRTSKSTFAVHLLLALEATYGKLINRQSFREDHIGSPHGDNLAATKVITSSTARTVGFVSDSNAYRFNIRSSEDQRSSSVETGSGLPLRPSSHEFGHFVGFRVNRMQPTSRTSYRDYYDPSRPRRSRR